jgi:hypothetical protein
MHLRVYVRVEVVTVRATAAYHSIKIHLYITALNAGT